MLVITSFGGALAMLLLGLCCWGTGFSVLKLAELNSRVSSVFFISAQAFISCVACFTLGMISTEASPDSFVSALRRVDALGALAAVVGGGFIAGANGLLTEAIGICGVAVAVPAVIGSGLLGGTVLNYIVDPVGDAVLLFVGVAFCAAALGFNQATHLSKESRLRTQKAQEETNEQASKAEQPVATSLDPEASTAADDTPEKVDLEAGNKASTTKQAMSQTMLLIVMLFTGGGLSAIWSPLSTWAIKFRELGVYECMFFFNLGQLLVIPFLVGLAYCGPSKESRVLDWGTWKQQLLCVVAGFINFGGLLALFISGAAVSFAMSFGILQCSPFIAALIGVFAFGEMKGAAMREVGFFVAMLAMYGSAIACLASSQA
eukprot:TRINITY_DN44907_c0_g1_i1.p1 TRINITY_DN44907_c0_g1~~TRINITY_DN44907_c0_g1_i1.p1  ORF type:complete len:375 (+),score=56.75 TRINITY_DN44907_c0_g1_i1:97-1221(+)